MTQDDAGTDRERTDPTPAGGGGGGGVSAGTDTGDAAETTDAEEILGDVHEATGESDGDVGRGAD